ncbi:hydroxysqualene dehydroxylase HpnE [Chitinibacteraceae bacterium HSL-7]
MKKVAVIGGGYAGMAAAQTLATAGIAATVFEAGQVLGGRARRVELDGRLLDNGQHLLVGAYRTLLALMREAELCEADVLLRTPLDLPVRPDFRLRCPHWRAPWHLLGALVRAEGLDWSERFQLARALGRAQRDGWRVIPDRPVKDWLLEQGQSTRLVERFWQPLTVAALNTPLESASTQVLFNTLRDSLAGDADASNMLFPCVDFSALYPDAAARVVLAAGGEVKCSAMIRNITQNELGWRVGEAQFDAVVCALPPHRVSMVLGEHLPELAAQLDDWNYQPIVTLYLEYPRASLPQPMVGLSGGLVQWVFDHGHTHDEANRIAVVLSAQGAHSQLARADLEAAVVAELDAAFAWGVPTWSRSINEKRATFACVPGLDRPDNATKWPTLWLAGDYTRGDYPATLEGAVQSGVRAARGVLEKICD